MSDLIQKIGTRPYTVKVKSRSSMWLRLKIAGLLVRWAYKIAGISIAPMRNDRPERRRTRRERWRS